MKDNMANWTSVDWGVFALFIAVVVGVGLLITDSMFEIVLYSAAVVLVGVASPDRETIKSRWKRQLGMTDGE